MELVDTDVLIDFQRGHPPAVAWFSALANLPSVSGFVAMELIQNARNAREVRRAQKLISPFRVVWPAESDCDRALSYFAKYHHAHGLGLLDALIAASAVGFSATLYIFNDKHYRVVPGLVMAQPYVR